MAFERNDIVNKTRLMGELGEELMGYEHNDIVTMDVMNKAIEEGGGGGGGDFTTAQVTLICNASDEVIVNIAMAVDAEPPFEPNPQTSAYITMGNGDEYTETAVLYKGYCSCSFAGASALSGEGDVTILDNWNAIITGDCTITIS